MPFPAMPPMSVEFLSAFASDVARIRLGKPQQLRPLILTYFVTFRCDLRCSYCDYAEDGFARRVRDLDTTGARAVLRICREGIPAVAFSGGEPLVRDDIVELVRYAKTIDYKPVSLFTNSLHLEEKEEVLDSVDYLQVSLDTLDTGLQDRLCGKVGVGERIVNNITHYAALQRQKRFRLNINCVLSPENLDTVDELLRFAADIRARFTFSPQLDRNGQPAQALLDPDVRLRYHEAVRTILSYKRTSSLVLDIVPFIRHVKEFQSGPCHPLLTPRVYPDGTLRFPCSIVCRTERCVVQLGTWKQVEKELRSTSSECDSRCLLPCYLESSLLAEHPFSLLQEIM